MTKRPAPCLSSSGPLLHPFNEIDYVSSLGMTRVTVVPVVDLRLSSMFLVSHILSKGASACRYE